MEAGVDVVVMPSIDEGVAPSSLLLPMVSSSSSTLRVCVMATVS